ncbi:MAG: hypothetical protein IPM35_17020 [Myxococcales bacterium]|nr:hypothetical protein [Myxococcales bacterium]
MSCGAEFIPQGPRGPTGPAGAAGATGPTGPQGPAGITDEGIFQSWIEFFIDRHGSFGNVAAGSFTTGARYLMKSARTITGIRFVWGGAVARTIKACLWQYGGGGARLVTAQDCAVNGAGIYVATFAVPYVVPAAYVGSSILASIWEKSGTEYTRFTTAGIGDASVTQHLTIGRHVTVQEEPKRYGAGDVNPANLGAGEWYAVEPVVT